MIAVALLFVACRPEPVPETDTEPEVRTIVLTPFAEGLAKPVAIEVRPGDDALYVVEQPGRIQRVAADGSKTLFLDLRAAVVDDGWEQGLLGLAFPPDHATSGRFYVNFTRAADGATVLARFRVTSDGTSGDAESREDLIVVPQPYENHNAGHLAFGPDGFLYFGLGDGGLANDPHGHGQDATTLLGSMLRIDVSGEVGHSAPPTNPFVGDDGIPDETWAIGLRNPWKYTFDARTGDLYIADVGQNQWEEINVQPAASTGGENYGWDTREGMHCFQAANCETEGMTDPVHEFAHGPACSVTGGHVYRGSALPELDGAYFFADFCSNQVWSLRWQAGVVSDVREWTNELTSAGAAIDGPSTFGVDAAGELYLAHLNSGVIHRFGVAPSGR